MASNAKKQIQYPVQPVLLQSLETLMTNIDSPYKLIYGCILILIIVYSSVIPSDYKLFADSILGRVFGIGIIYGVIQSVGWIYGLLTAMAFLLILHGSRSTLQEGFDGGGTISEKKIIGKRWFVEKVLGETPSKIAVDRVITAAPGDS
jgi:hypothetical protein